MSDQPTSPDDAFDRIVEAMEGEFDVDDITRSEMRQYQEPPDDVSYREVAPARFRFTQRTAAATTGVLITPLLLLVALITYVSSALLITATVVSVASAIYLIWQLPEHGPSQEDWPDDGAVL